MRPERHEGDRRCARPRAARPRPGLAAAWPGLLGSRHFGQAFSKSLVWAGLTCFHPPKKKRKDREGLSARKRHTIPARRKKPKTQSFRSNSPRPHHDSHCHRRGPDRGSGPGGGVPTPARLRECRGLSPGTGRPPSDRCFRPPGRKRQRFRRLLLLQRRPPGQDGRSLRRHRHHFRLRRHRCRPPSGPGNAGRLPRGGAAAPAPVGPPGCVRPLPDPRRPSGLHDRRMRPDRLQPVGGPGGGALALLPRLPGGRLRRLAARGRDANGGPVQGAPARD